MEATTMLRMAKKKQDKNEVPPEKKKRVVRAHRWDPDLLAAIDAWREAQEVAPSDISVVEKAVKEWLGERGYWPLPDNATDADE